MSISKVNIEEANTHLRELHKKVFELENRIQMQAMHVEELQKANTQLQRKLGKLRQEKDRQLAEKDAFIEELNQRVGEAESHVQQLLSAAEERDSVVVQMERRARLFYEVVEHRSSIARILEVLEELSVGEDMEEEGEGEEGEDVEEEREEGVARGDVGTTTTTLLGASASSLETPPHHPHQGHTTSEPTSLPHHSPHQEEEGEGGRETSRGNGCDSTNNGSKPEQQAP